MLLFIVNYLFFFWSTWITCFTRIINNTHYDWALLCMKYFKTNIRIRGPEKLYEDNDCVYLTNHRCQGDFFIDQVLTKGRSIFISRWMVGYFFFMFIPVSLFGRSLLFFKRKKGIGRGYIYNLVDKYNEKSPYPSLLIYPEGTRHQKSNYLKLKTGFIKYAYDKNLPVQIFITKNKEKILCSQTLTSQFGVTIETEYSKPIFPNEFKSYNDFENTIIEKWDKIWQSTYNDGNKEKEGREMIYNNVKVKPINSKINVTKFYIGQISLITIYLSICYYLPLFLLLPYCVILFNLITKK